MRRRLLLAVLLALPAFLWANHGHWTDHYRSANGSLGMVSAATAYGIGSDIQRLLATVVVGGLLSTFALTLFTLPALYGLTVQCQRTHAG